MRQAILLPEMVQAGAETYLEMRGRGRLHATEIAVAIYLAMEAIREIAEMQQDDATVH